MTATGTLMARRRHMAAQTPTGATTRPPRRPGGVHARFISTSFGSHTGNLLMIRLICYCMLLHALLVHDPQTSTAQLVGFDAIEG